ncbi:uncharacterized protein B0H64DRAFT_376692 [Chaetomium fimeti]|uniref:Uncharacterized protein n=1 Tax=Chaetomium fimeti TaxID=1854472 RepID=A0AAE0H939_9PEZI|nr:hypothetical protein B0H64DRAFT_376692 [Chaetomium fimeti]
MAFHFDPALQFDLEVPIRVELFVPLHLLHRFHPSIEPVTTPGNHEDLMTPRNPLKALKPTALTIAKVVSKQIFGSTEAVREDLRPIGFWAKDGTLEAIFFYLNHRLRIEDVGLNPEYIRVAAREGGDGELVLEPAVVMGERREENNHQAEGRWQFPSQLKMHVFTLSTTHHPPTMETKRPKDQPIAAILLGRAHDTDEATRIFTEKVQQRPLFLTPSSPPPSDARAARRRAQEKKKQQRKKALKPKPLSATQRRRLGLYDVPRAAQRYALFEPLHRLWLGYVREILGAEVYTGGEGAAAKLASADFHGAGVEVVRSGCVSRVGIEGIVVKDSKFAFEVVTRRNQVKLVPKEGTVFRFVVPVPDVGGEEGEGQAAQTSSMVFEIHGEQFQFRSADRASRKFRSHFSKKL